MKTKTYSFFVIFTLTLFMFYGCSKSGELNNAEDSQQLRQLTSNEIHFYGIKKMSPEQILRMPVYSMESFPLNQSLKTLKLSYRIPWNPAVRNQGQIGSCSAFCGVETDEILYHFKPNNKDFILSPAFIYYCERVLIQKYPITADEGAYMEDIVHALQTYGDCKEVSYPYPPSNTSLAYKTPPSSAAITEALKYSTGQNKFSFAMLPAGNLNAVKLILSTNTPVMMGFTVYDIPSSYPLFEGLDKKNSTYNPLTPSGALVDGAEVLGGHAVPIIGFDDVNQRFLCQNSWGTPWGNSGFFYLPYKVYQSPLVVGEGSCYSAILY